MRVVAVCKLDEPSVAQRFTPPPSMMVFAAPLTLLMLTALLAVEMDAYVPSATMISVASEMSTAA
jgi:hypothetical protein